jgi:8-oxo-dGTP diphosphatase
MRAGGSVDPTSGDGFVRVADGSLRWGRYGGAGLLVRHVAEPADAVSYFVALRSQLTHMGGTWGIPGGALAEGETPVEAAVREFREEVGLALTPERIALVHEDDHGGWSYWTVVVDVPERFALPGAAALNWETAGTGWIPHHRLSELELHDAFRRTLVRLGFLD